MQVQMAPSLGRNGPKTGSPPDCKILTPVTRDRLDQSTSTSTDSSNSLLTVGSKRCNANSDPLVMANPNANTKSPCN